MPAHAERTALYRLYDADGLLLYVGISADPKVRWKGHEVYSCRWWHLVARKSVEWHADRWLALAHEYLAILRENPVHNRRRTPPNTHKWRNRQAADLLDHLPAADRPQRRLRDKPQ